MLSYRTNHPCHRQSIQHHGRPLAAILGIAATSSLYRISNLNTLHTSPMVTARETVPRRCAARYTATVNNDSDPASCVRSSQRTQVIRHIAEVARGAISRCSGQFDHVNGPRISGHVALDIVRRPKATPIHELERYMRCKDCSQVRRYPYKRSYLVALRPTKISADDPPSTWWPGER
jgi:hypothetical protein